MEQLQLKSEKIPQGKKLAILWGITLVLLCVVLIWAGIKYKSYRNGQDAGIDCIMLVTSKFNSVQDHTELVHKIHDYIEGERYSVTVQGYKIDYSDYNDSIRKVRNTLGDVMRSLGYDEYYVSTYFECTNFFEFLFRLFISRNLIPIVVFLIAFMIALIPTIKCFTTRNMELTVDTDSVICRKNSGKTLEFLFKDITGVELAHHNGLVLKGNNIKFKITQIKNGNELKNAVIEKMITVQSGNLSSSGTASEAADSIKRYKDLLDSGAITQDEFDVKKKQLLGL